MPPAASASEKEVTVAQWFVAGVQTCGSKDRGPLRIYGIPHGASKQQQRSLWRSGSIVRRISSTVLETRFGTRVRLYGPIDSTAASRMSMTKDAVNAFASGFPPRWRTIALQAFSVAPRAIRNTLEEPVLMTASNHEATTNTSKKSRIKPPKRARSAHRIQMVSVPLSEFKPNGKKRRASEPPPTPLIIQTPQTARARGCATKTPPTLKKTKKIANPTDSPDIQQNGNDSIKNKTEKDETEKMDVEVIDLVTPSITPPSQLVHRKEHRTPPKSKPRFCVDSLLGRREVEIENGEPACPAVKKNKRKTIVEEDIYDFPEPTPVLPATKPADSQMASDSKKKKTDKTKTGKPVSKKSALKKKKVAISKNAPVSTKKTRKSTISFKDQLVEVEEEPPAPRRASRRAARLAKAALAASATGSPEKAPETPTDAKVKVTASVGIGKSRAFCNDNEWTDEQVEAYERMRGTVPGDSHQYWAEVAAGVPGRTEEECSGRFWESAKTPEKRRNVVQKSTKADEKSTPEVAAKYAEKGVTKAHTKTAKFAQNMRRIVAANAKEVLESGENMFVPPRVEGYSPATPKRFEWGEDPITPGTEARERLRQLEAPKIETPEPYQRGATAISVADRIAAQFKKKFGHLTGIGGIGEADKEADSVEKNAGKINDEGLNMADVLRGTERNVEENDAFTPRINRQKLEEDSDGASESEEDKII